MDELSAHHLERGGTSGPRCHVAQRARSRAVADTPWAVGCGFARGLLLKGPQANKEKRGNSPRRSVSDRCPWLRAHYGGAAPTCRRAQGRASEGLDPLSSSLSHVLGGRCAVAWPSTALLVVLCGGSGSSLCQKILG